MSLSRTDTIDLQLNQRSTNRNQKNLDFIPKVLAGIVLKSWSQSVLDFSKFSCPGPAVEFSIRFGLDQWIPGLNGYLGVKIYEMHKIITQYFRCNFGNHSRRRIQRCQRIHFCCSIWYLPLFITFDIISSITKSHVRVNTISINGVSKTRTVETYACPWRFSPCHGNHHTTSLFQK